MVRPTRPSCTGLPTGGRSSPVITSIRTHSSRTETPDPGDARDRAITSNRWRVLVLMPLEPRFEVLKKALRPAATHVAVGQTSQIGGDPVTDVLSKPGRAERLKQRQLVELVILVVDDRVTLDLGMAGDPGQDLVASRRMRH